MSQSQAAIRQPVFTPLVFNTEAFIANAESADIAEGLSTLEHGDRLTLDEFERRYETMPELKKAELVEGVVYMPSPVRHKRHGRPNGDFVGWISFYVALTPGSDYSVNGSIRLSNKSGLQPDAMLRLLPEVGGGSRVDDDDYIVGPPELVVEIAASTASYDLHDKKETYRKHGVLEYIVWRVEDRQIDWFNLTDGQYVSLAPNENGVIESNVFPGLRLNLPAIMAGKQVDVFLELQNGLNSAEHQAFVERLIATIHPEAPKDSTTKN